MARNKANQTNIDNSNPTSYPDARIKNNTGSNDGTPVNEVVYGDMHELMAKAMRLYGINYNSLPDNETNGYQLLDAFIALASKNDFVLDLTTSTGVLNIPLKLGKLKDNESFILKATIDKTTETDIKGTLDSVSKTVTFLGDFKQNEYVRMINTASSVVLIRLIDNFNLDGAVGDLSFLKAASQVEEDAGVINTVATTPLVNKSTFEKRVVGSDSGGYLAIPTSAGPTARNGLISSADKEKLDAFQSNERNYGTVSGIDVGAGTVGQLYAVTGDLSNATLIDRGNGNTLIEVTLANAMDNTNYEVQINLESTSTNYRDDNDIGQALFRKIGTTVVHITLDEFNSQSQDLTLHISVKQR